MAFKAFKSFFLLLAINSLVLVSTACNGGASSNHGAFLDEHITDYTLPLRTPFSTHNIIVPTRGDVYIQQGNVILDKTNVNYGYIMVQYDGDSPRVVVRVEPPNDYPYQNHDLTRYGTWDVLTLTRGSGLYSITVLENVEGQLFATVLHTTVEVELYDELLPFLTPNRYVNFNKNSNAVALAYELAIGARTELEVVRAIYAYIIQNISYDHELAAQITSGIVATYVPDIDRTLKTRVGICFDYAALMAAMLRSQNIPTRLEIGFVTDIYHAWVSIHTQDYGWIHAVHFSGYGWSLMDPTFSAAGPGLEEFIGDASNYNTLFLH